MRNPLNAAQLQLELASRRMQRSGSGSELLAPIDAAQREIERVSNLLDDLLAFARPAQLALGDHDIVAIAHQVVELERPRAERTGATVELVGSTEPAIARVDPEKLHQVIQNLVRNAIEASPRGRITLGVVVADASVCIRVADDGPGIPDDVRRRIFEPFSRPRTAAPAWGWRSSTTWSARTAA